MFGFPNTEKVTVKINDTIYTGSFKIIYQTFKHKNLKMFYNNEWYPIELFCQQTKNQEFYKLVTHSGRIVVCNQYQSFMVNNEEKLITDIKINDKIEVEKHCCEKINSTEDGYDIIDLIIKTNPSDNDWVFNLISNSDWITLSNGIHVKTLRS